MLQPSFNVFTLRITGNHPGNDPMVEHTNTGSTCTCCVCVITHGGSVAQNTDLLVFYYQLLVCGKLQVDFVGLVGFSVLERALEFHPCDTFSVSS